MGLVYWNKKEIPDETYLAWEIFYENQGEIGQTTGMFSSRGRAVKDGRELIFFDESMKSSHKMRQATKEMVRTFVEYNESLKN